MALASVSIGPPPPLQAKTNKYKIALCQLQVTPDKDGNIAHARARRRQARRPAGNLELPLRDGDPAKLRRGHRRRRVAVGIDAVGGGRCKKDHCSWWIHTGEILGEALQHLLRHRTWRRDQSQAQEAAFVWN